MKFSSVLYIGTLAAAALAAPLAELERQHFGRSVERTDLTPELAKRMPKGSSSRSKGDRDRIAKIKSTRYKGDDEVEYDYAQRIRDAPQYQAGWKPIRDNTPPRGSTGTVLRRNSRDEVYKADHYYAEDTQPYTADLWARTTKVYPQYEDHGFKMRHGAAQRDYTLETPHIHVPKYAKGTDREEEPPQSLDYPQGGFLVGRVPAMESRFQSRMLSAVDRPYPSAEHSFHDNRVDTSREVHVVRGPRSRDSNGAYDYNPRYGIPRVPSSRVDSYLYPGQPPSSQGRSSSGANIVTIAPRGSSSSDRRRDVALFDQRDIFDNIEGQQGNASDTSRTTQMEQIEGYIWAFQQARDNATMGEAMAWGLYQMVHPDIAYVGPFQKGFSNFGNSANATNTTGNATNDQVWNDWGDAVNAFYADLWQNATEAVNATGLLSDLDLLEGYLIPDDHTLLPDTFTTVDDHSLDSFYDFLASMYDYNGYVFTANQTENGEADFSLYPEDFEYGPDAFNGSASSNTTTSKRSPSWNMLW